MKNSKTLSVMCLLLLGAIIGLGCGGGSNGQRSKVSLSGKVTYDGKPVSKGRIEFEPDAKEGNKGPVVEVEIRDGAYQAPASQGPISGPHIIRIHGYTGEATATDPNGTPLFPVFTNTLDIPASRLEFNFNVPATR